MNRFDHCTIAVIVAFFLGCGVLQASQNLLRNGGFEAAEKDLPEGWSVQISGDWVGEGKVAGREVVNISSDARTGKNALVIDTTQLNPEGKITDDLRTWYEPKYQIAVKQSVKGLKPDSWYLLKFRVKSPRVVLDEGLRFLANVRPFPRRGYKRELGKWSINTWERRAFLPQAPIADGQYHEYVQLKYIYPDSESMEVGVDVRAPWSGKIIIDDVELTAIDPDKTMSRMEKLLAMRTARPLAKVRELNRRTRLVDEGRGVGCILIPEDDSYTKSGAKIRAEVKRLTGADLPVVRRLADVPDGAPIVAIGSMMHNELVARLHFNRYVKVDALSPGPGGYVIWTVAEPYGLAKKQNVIVVAGSDAAGQEAAVDALCRLLAKCVK